MPAQDRRGLRGHGRVRAAVVGLAVGATLVAPGASAVAAGSYRRVWPEVPVTAMAENLQLGNNSPTLLADPGDTRFVALANRLDNPDFDCALHVSGDGGRHWVPVQPVPELPAGADKCYAPEIAFDGDGVLHYLFIALAGNGNNPSGTYLVTSADRGRTFSAPRRVLGPERYMVRMAIDRTMGSRGRLHLVWLEAKGGSPLGGLGPPPNPIMAAYSDDGARTFSTPVQVSDPARARVVAPALALGPDHRVHVLYYDLGDDARDYQGLEGPTWEGNWSLVLASSSDGGEAFGASVVVDDEVTPPERVMLIYTMAPPALAVDDENRIFAAWYDARSGDWDVFLRRSVDGGGSWEGRRRLNDDAKGNGRHQYLPRLAVAPDGRLDAVFYDRRNDRSNVRNNVYVTSSSDGAASFLPNVRLTSEASSSQIGTRYPIPSALGLVEFGSRIAVLSERSRIVAAWTDTRNQDVDSFGQDIFATQVEVGAESGEPWWRSPIAAGAFGLVVAIGAGAVLVRRRRGPPPSEPE